MHPADRDPAPRPVRCRHCPRDAVAVVEVDDERRTTAACRDHLEWAFLAGLDGWPQRRPTG